MTRTDLMLPVSVCNLSRINSLARILVNIIMAISIADNQKHQRSAKLSQDNKGDAKVKEEGETSDKSGTPSESVHVKSEGSNVDQQGKEKGGDMKKEKGEKDGGGDLSKTKNEDGDEKDAANADDSAGEEQFVNFDAMLRDLGQLEKVRYFIFFNLFIGLLFAYFFYYYFLIGAVSDTSKSSRRRRTE